MVNSYGVEVHVPQNLGRAHSLLAKGTAGVVDAVDVCSGGVKDFLNFPHKYLKPQGSQKWLKPPKLRVAEDEWETVARGLLDRGICVPGHLRKYTQWKANHF